MSHALPPRAVIVTGAVGLHGSRTIDLLFSEGHCVLGVDDLSRCSRLDAVAHPAGRVGVSRGEGISRLKSGSRQPLGRPDIAEHKYGFVAKADFDGSSPQSGSAVRTAWCPLG